MMFCSAKGQSQPQGFKGCFWILQQVIYPPITKVYSTLASALHSKLAKLRFVRNGQKFQILDLGAGPKC